MHLQKIKFHLLTTMPNSLKNLKIEPFLLLKSNKSFFFLNIIDGLVFLSSRKNSLHLSEAQQTPLRSDVKIESKSSSRARWGLSDKF